MTDLFGHKKMRALSWKQPFATLMLHGKTETRTWNTEYRGQVLICASLQPYTPSMILDICGGDQQDRIAILFAQHSIKLRDYTGYAIAVGELVYCRPMEPSDEDACFVRYSPGLHCHIYENIKPIEPIKWKGLQGWKSLDTQFISQLDYI